MEEKQNYVSEVKELGTFYFQIHWRGRKPLDIAAEDQGLPYWHPGYPAEIRAIFTEVKDLAPLVFTSVTSEPFECDGLWLIDRIARSGKYYTKSIAVATLNTYFYVAIVSDDGKPRKTFLIRHTWQARGPDRTPTPCLHTLFIEKGTGRLFIKKSKKNPKPQ